jgi:prolyl-tRNA synthetase
MRVSKLFFQTLREVPADADTVSHQLMLRAGMIHQIAAGIFDILPLALRIKHKIEDIIREEMDAIGGQEVTLPMVHPAEIWQRSRALVSDRQRHGAAQGSQRPRHVCWA